MRAFGGSRFQHDKQWTMQLQLTPDNGTAPPRFRIGDLEIDVGKAEVRRGDKKIALTKLSFDLLLALIHAAPSIVTTEDLLSRVWPGLLVSSESVSQRVKLLRTAIGDDSQHPRYILAVRGRGYRLIPVVERCDSNLSTSDATNPPITPPGVEVPAEPARQSFSLQRSSGRLKRVVIAVAVLVAMGIVVVLGRRYWSTTNNAAQSATVAMVDRSIAVLPFTDMSEKKDQEYFADGMAEEIIDLLVKIPGLKVISRTSSFQFKGKTEDLRSIGTQLGVAYVLEGSVRKSDERLRVTAELIDSRDGVHLFSQTYDRELSDVLKMQGEIAAQVGRALQIEVSAAYDMIPRPALGNTEAYTLYLQGLHALDRFDQPGLEQALNDFQRAFALDPSFAAATNRLGQVYSVLGEFGVIPQTIAIEKVRHYVELTLKLDPNRAETLAALGGVVHGAYDWDWAAADTELEQARALAPSNAAVMALSARQSIIMGRWDDALQLLNACLELDPLNPRLYSFLTFVQVQRGHLADAEAAARRTLEISPTFTLAHYWLGIVLLMRHQPEGALTEMLKEANDAPRIGGSSTAYLALGRKAESDAALAEMLNKDASHPYLIAQTYAFRGQLDEAFQWLERAYAPRDPLLYQIKFTPAFDKLHDDPRYKAILRKMNLPE
jgi:TolB-like protein/DNA-binding winged helix-turn-helix (wHTH) protein/Flp pilus assembly protein TadD